MTKIYKNKKCPILALFCADMSKNEFSAKTCSIERLPILYILSHLKVFSFHDWAGKVSIIRLLEGEGMFR